MLIVSPFHDYYDSIKAYGIDKSVVYCRTKRPLQGKGLPDIYSAIHYNYGQPDFYGRILGFCGKLYPLVEKDIRYGAPKQMIYDRKIAVGNEEDAYWGRKRSVVELFDDFPRDHSLLALFQAHKVPAFVYGDYLAEKELKSRYGHLILNPRLQDYGFQRIVPPAQAFQEIYMYISGVLGVPAPQTVDIDDKHKAIEKGHDGPYSFKRPPGGGRWR